jgi:hypothetical protein
MRAIDMRNFRTWLLGASALAVVASGGMLASAQTKSDDADISKMTVGEMTEAAGERVRKMEEMLSQAYKLLEESIEKGDVATTTSRNEAITAMKGLVKLSEENFLILQHKAAQSERKGVEHEYVKISIAAVKVGELFAQVRSAGSGAIGLEGSDVSATLSVGGQLPTSVNLPNQVGTTPSISLPTPPVAVSASAFL